MRAKPSWGCLYALAILMLTLLALADVYVPAGGWRRALEVVIAVSAFATMRLWVRANRRAFDLVGERNPGFRDVVDTARPADVEARRPVRAADPVMVAGVVRGRTVVALPRRLPPRWTRPSSKPRPPPPRPKLADNCRRGP